MVVIALWCCCCRCSIAVVGGTSPQVLVCAWGDTQSGLAVKGPKQETRTWTNEGKANGRETLLQSLPLSLCAVHSSSTVHSSSPHIIDHILQRYRRCPPRSISSLGRRWHLRTPSVVRLVNPVQLCASPTISVHAPRQDGFNTVWKLPCASPGAVAPMAFP